MTVVVVAVPDMNMFLDGDKSILVEVTRQGTHAAMETFPCLEAAERWIYSQWPSIKERTTPPEEAIDGHHYDAAEIRWVGVLKD